MMSYSAHQSLPRFRGLRWHLVRLCTKAHQEVSWYGISILRPHQVRPFSIAQVLGLPILWCHLVRTQLLDLGRHPVSSIAHLQPNGSWYGISILRPHQVQPFSIAQVVGLSILWCHLVRTQLLDLGRHPVSSKAHLLQGLWRRKKNKLLEVLAQFHFS